MSGFNLNVEINRLKKRIREKPDVESLKTLLRYLAAEGLIREIPKYLKIWRESLPLDEIFYTFLGLYYARTLKVGKLKGIWKKIPNEYKAVILMSYGYPEKALKLTSDEYTKANCYYLMGKDYELDKPLDDANRVIYNNILGAKYTLSGEFEKAINVSEENFHLAVSMGMYGPAINSYISKGIVECDTVPLIVASLVSKHLGDRYNYIKTGIYIRFFKGLRVRLKGDTAKIRYFRVLNDLASGKDGVYSLIGLKNLFWYLNKRKTGEMYLSFAGKLKLMKGKGEMKERKKTLIVLAFMKAFNNDADKVKKYAHLIFPESFSPKRRLGEYISRARAYIGVDTDAFITLRFGNFLRDEVGEWKNIILHRMKTYVGEH
ncbi:MAG: hypothetical protein ABIL41_02910 [candidate division WOR-3 bacterium]